MAIVQWAIASGNALIPYHYYSGKKIRKGITIGRKALKIFHFCLA